MTVTVTACGIRGKFEAPGDGGWGGAWVMKVDTCAEQELFKEVTEKPGFRES